MDVGFESGNSDHFLLRVLILPMTYSSYMHTY